jgi:hypothetical protein
MRCRTTSFTSHRPNWSEVLYFGGFLGGAAGFAFDVRKETFNEGREGRLQPARRVALSQRTRIEGSTGVYQHAYSIRILICDCQVRRNISIEVTDCNRNRSEADNVIGPRA